MALMVLGLAFQRIRHFESGGLGETSSFEEYLPPHLQDRN